MRSIITAAAAIALIAGAAHAQGNGKGGGQGGGPGGGHGAAHQGGGGGGDGQGGGKPDKGSRGQGGGGMQAAGAPQQGGGGKDRGNAGHQGGEAHGNGGQGGEARGNGNQGGGRGNQADNRDHGNAGRNDGRGNGAVVVDRGRGNGHGNGNVVFDRGRDVVRVASFGAVPRRGLIDGCPPGLAKKNPPCVPPGQARGMVRYDRPDFWGLRLGDGRYRYNDGYLFRLGPNGGIGGYIPLLGGALAVGHAWPTFYEPVALPVYYENYYGLGAYESYRYADNVIYRVDAETAAITSIAALLTGDDFAVGRPMPVGYDVYNVPYAYREQYYDRPDALYRYSDGYVYQVDPETRLIASAIELLAT